MVACAVLTPTHRFIGGFELFTVGIALYFYFVFFCCDRNYLDIRAIFPAVWQCTIGLAALRLTEYQEQWQAATWICLILAYVVFQIGASAGGLWGRRLCRLVPPDRFKKADWRIHENRLFWICVSVTLVGLACFIVNILIRGYIPFLESRTNMNAYVEFYTRFQIFSTAEVCISPLCYYCLKTQRLPVWKRAVLIFCIIYSTFLYPVMVVSRGAFLTAALMLACAVFYLNKRKLWVLIACAVVAAGVYGGCSILRGYSNDQLNEFFEPAEVQIGAPGSTVVSEPAEVETVSSDSVAASESAEVETVSSDGVAASESAEIELVPSDSAVVSEPVPEETAAIPVELEESAGKTFVLSAKWAFVYSYLTVSHDNLNEAVKYTDTFTHGIRQLEPFNVLLRISKLQEAIENAPHYLVREHLNTVNLIGDAYYDFGIPGVAVFMFLWSFLFGIVQQVYFVREKPFALLALGNVLTPVALCFFDPWMSEFSFWMYWGLTLLMLLAAAVPAKKAAGHKCRCRSKYQLSAEHSVIRRKT